VNLIEPGEDTGLEAEGVEDETEYTYEDEEITVGMMENYSHVLWSLGDFCWHQNRRNSPSDIIYSGPGIL
jgi:calcineurin-like phosphoesterase family protein